MCFLSFPGGNAACQSSKLVNIRFTSSLTPDDENAIAPVVLNTLARILDLLPIAYAIRIDTADSRVYLHSRPETPPDRVLDQARSDHLVG